MRVLQQNVLTAAGPAEAQRDIVQRKPEPVDHGLSRVRRDLVSPGRGAAALARARESVVCAAGVGVVAVLKGPAQPGVGHADRKMQNEGWMWEALAYTTPPRLASLTFTPSLRFCVMMRFYIFL